MAVRRAERGEPLTDVHLTGALPGQYSHEFLQGMVERTAVSFHKYGAVKASIEKGMDPIASAIDRIRQYQRDGNTEWLMDAANYLQFEFMYPSHENAHFRATDSDESPGRLMTDTTRHSKHESQMGGDL